MALIALRDANLMISVEQSVIQMTLTADEAITAGAPVRINTTTGKFTNANGTTAPEARIYGIATRTVAAQDAVTAIRKGVLDGFNLDSQAYDLPIFLADTDGRLGDVAGTVSTVAGRVIPAEGHLRGNAPDKLLFVDL